MTSDNMLYDHIADTVEFLRQKHPGFQPNFGIILGSGLGNAISGFRILKEIPYSDIPHFPASSVIGHKGRLLFAEYKDKHILVMSGRIHYYQGHTMQEVTFPVRVLKALGVKTVIITAAAGGLQGEFEEGQLILLKDQINLMPANPLRGPNDERLGVRFPDMSNAFSPDVRKSIQGAAEEIFGSPLYEGVYAGVAGPSLETPAEYVFLHRAGADLVGMSVVPEVIVARHAGMDVAGLAVVSNVCYPPERVKFTTAEMVVAVASEAATRLGELLERLFRENR